VKTTDIAALRIDKWLWFTRFYKSRGLATRAVVGGHVRINGVRAKPSAEVRPGDMIDIVRDQLPWRIQADAVPVRRGPAAEARKCYTEDAEVCRQREQMQAERRIDRMQMPRTAGRPDKHTRRKLRERRRS